MIGATDDIWGVNLFNIFVDELGKERALQLLGVPESMLKRWRMEKSPVPRMAVLALFWETNYGRSMVNTSQVNEIRLLYRRVHHYHAQFVKAKDIVAGLRRLHSGTANEPYFEEMLDVGGFAFQSLNKWGEFEAHDAPAKERVGTR